jgi:hypothetical protein
MSTLTSANATLAIAVAGIFSSPQVIQGYATDDAFDSESVAQSEVMMGVDGIMSAGKVFTPYKMTIHLLPSSPSMSLFETWRNQQDAQVDVFRADGSITIPSIGRIYTLQKGFLTSAPAFPSAKKMLAPIAFEITWERIIATPTA